MNKNHFGSLFLTLDTYVKSRIQNQTRKSIKFKKKISSRWVPLEEDRHHYSTNPSIWFPNMHPTHHMLPTAVQTITKLRQWPYLSRLIQTQQAKRNEISQIQSLTQPTRTRLACDRESPKSFLPFLSFDLFRQWHELPSTDPVC